MLDKPPVCARCGLEDCSGHPVTVTVRVYTERAASEKKATLS